MGLQKGLRTAIALACLGVAPAWAGGFQLREDNAVAMGSAFAGSGTGVSGPAAVFDNPAAMTMLPGLQIQAGGSLLIPSFVFHGTAVDAFGRPVAGASGRDGGNPGFVPDGFATYQLRPDLWLGVGFTAPFGLATSYGTNFVGRYQADKTSLYTYNLNPGVAYRVADWLSLGAGVSVQYARAEFSNFINASTVASAALGRPVALPDGYFRLRGDDWSWGYNLGALLQPGPQTRIGLSYRSRVQLDLSGTAGFQVPGLLAANPLFRNSGATAKLTLPDTATLSFAQGLGPQWTLLADLSWTNWSQFKQLNAFRTDGTPITSTPQHYDNTFFASIGASYAVNDALTLRGGVAFDKSPVSNAYRTARVPDQDRVWLSAGASVAVAANVKLDVAYTHVFVNDARLADRSSTNDLLFGYYTNSVDVISLGARMQF